MTNEQSLISGFPALDALDSNRDGVINSHDAAWASLKVWVDASGNAAFSAGSLQTLDQLGIASISLNANHVNTNQNTNTILDDSTFTWNSGATGDIAGVDFNFHASSVTSAHGGGDPTDPPPNCVHVDSILPSGVRAGDVMVGSVLELSDPHSLEPATGIVTYSKRVRSTGLRLRTSEGTSLCCSDTAPIATADGLVIAPHLLGKRIPVRKGASSDGIIDWQTVVSLEFLGEIDVQHITVGDRCFWAGEKAHEYVLHHNRKADRISG